MFTYAKYTTALSYLFMVLILISPSHATAMENDKSLSPYFFIEGNDSNTESFPLLDTQVDAKISGVIAKVTVKQRYSNRGTTPIHAKYIFPGSTRAAVHGLKMTIGDRVVRAKIKEREEARQIYEAARAEGKSTSLLEQQRPNVFSMEVANIMPGDIIDVELEYSERLLPEDGVYEFVYPTVVGPRYTNPKRSGVELWVANPYLKEGSAPKTNFGINVHLATGMPVQDVACGTHPVKIEYDAPSIARVALDTKEFTGNRDYILRYRLAGNNVASGLMLFEGAEENFFLLMAQPPQRPTIDQIPGREYIFVVDVSGSMHGFPINTTKVLLKDLIGSLRPDDRFNMLFFSGSSELMSPESLPATKENIEQALNLLSNFSGQGGTELLPALQQALNLKAAEGFSRSMVVITDGYISAEKEAFDLIRNNLGNTNVFAFGIGSSVNRHLIEGLAKVGRGEPFILTDPAEARSMAKRFSDYIAEPVLTNVKVAYNGFDAYDLEPATVPDLFAQRPILVFGKWRGDRKGSITVTGVNGNGTYQQTFNVADVTPDANNEALRYLWARERLVQISDYDDYNQNENKQAIVALGLKYNLLTQHTSFVAVDEVVRNPKGNGKDVKQPVPLPLGVSERAVSVPEPEFWLLLALALLIMGKSLPLYRRITQKNA